MPPIVSTDWRRCIFPPNQLFLYFTTTKVIEKASNYKVLFNNVCRLAAAPLNCCKLRATRLASGHFSAASSRGIFQQITDFITFCAIEWRILKVNELRCKNGYHWVAQAKSEPCFALLRAIRPCAAYRGRHKYISYISNIRLAPWFFT